MIKYLLYRIPGIIITLLILTWVILATLKWMPGDAVVDAIGGMDSYYVVASEKGYAQYKQTYKKEAERYLLDVPTGYITVYPSFYTSEMDTVFPLSAQKSMKALAAHFQDRTLAWETLHFAEKIAFNERLSFKQKEPFYKWLNHQYTPEEFDTEVSSIVSYLRQDSLGKAFVNMYFKRKGMRENAGIFPNFQWNTDNAMTRVFWGKEGKGGWMRGDWGRSTMSQRSIPDLISDHIWPTFRLALFAMVLALFLGTTLGILASKWNHKIWEFSFLFVYTIPTFALASIFIFLFVSSFGSPWFESYGEEVFGEGENALVVFFKYLTLPAISMAIPMSIYLAKNLRDRILEQKKLEYVRAARSRGLSEAQILRYEIMPNVLPYYVGVLGQMLPDLLAGSIIIEFIFARNGMGQLFLQSVFYKDLALVLVLIWLMGVVNFLGNTFTDIWVSKLDKRIAWR